MPQRAGVAGAWTGEVPAETVESMLVQQAVQEVREATGQDERRSPPGTWRSSTPSTAPSEPRPATTTSWSRAVARPAAPPRSPSYGPGARSCWPTRAPARPRPARRWCPWGGCCSPTSASPSRSWAAAICPATAICPPGARPNCTPWTSSTTRTATAGTSTVRCFDRRLRAAARAAGAEVAEHTGRTVPGAAAGRHLAARPARPARGEAERTVRCRWVVDATGRGAAIAVRSGARRRTGDRLTAFHLTLDPAPRTVTDGRSLVESDAGRLVVHRPAALPAPPGRLLHRPRPARGRTRRRAVPRPAAGHPARLPPGPPARPHHPAATPPRPRAQRTSGPGARRRLDGRRGRGGRLRPAQLPGHPHRPLHRAERGPGGRRPAARRPGGAGRLRGARSATARTAYQHGHRAVHAQETRWTDRPFWARRQRTSAPTPHPRKARPHHDPHTHGPDPDGRTPAHPPLPAARQEEAVLLPPGAVQPPVRPQLPGGVHLHPQGQRRAAGDVPEGPGAARERAGLLLPALSAPLRTPGATAGQGVQRPSGAGRREAGRQPRLPADDDDRDHGGVQEGGRPLLPQARTAALPRVPHLPGVRRRRRDPPRPPARGAPELGRGRHHHHREAHRPGDC